MGLLSSFAPAPLVGLRQTRGVEHAASLSVAEADCTRYPYGYDG